MAYMECTYMNADILYCPGNMKNFLRQLKKAGVGKNKLTTAFRHYQKDGVILSFFSSISDAVSKCKVNRILLGIKTRTTCFIMMDANETIVMGPPLSPDAKRSMSYLNVECLHVKREDVVEEVPNPSQNTLPVDKFRTVPTVVVEKVSPHKRKRRTLAEAFEEGRVYGMKRAALCTKAEKQAECVEAQYLKGHSDGFLTGNIKGFKDGEAKGYQKGKVEGMKEGKAEAFKKGKLEGMKEGEGVGYKKGEIAGRGFMKDMQSRAYQDGKRAGFSEGYDVGSKNQNGMKRKHGEESQLQSIRRKLLHIAKDIHPDKAASPLDRDAATKHLLDALAAVKLMLD